MQNCDGRAARFCPHLIVDEMTACAACEGQQYLPSEFQQKEYCIGGGYTFCAIYMMHAPDTALTRPLSRSDR
jgi:hypothetical protein